jgi:hypothetical protein
MFSLAITHFSEEYAALFRNDGALSFTDVSYESGIARGSDALRWMGRRLLRSGQRWMARPDSCQRACVSAGGHRLEAVVENLVGKPMILRPEGGPRNHWVSFQLEGVKCNRLALNGRIQAIAGDLVQLGEVISSGSYLSQNDLRIHFGLGSHDRVDKAKIIWPDGKVETITNLAADRFYSIREGSGVVSSNAPATEKADKR